MSSAPMRSRPGVAINSAQRLPEPSVADEDRNFSVRENLIRHAAQDDRGNAAAAVRRHDDEIAFSLLGGLDNRLMGMILQDLRGFALDPRRARCFGHCA